MSEPTITFRLFSESYLCFMVSMPIINFFFFTRDKDRLWLIRSIMTCFLLSCMYSFIQQNFIECKLWPRHGAGLVLWHMQEWNKTHCSSQASLSGTKKSSYWLCKRNYPGRQWFRMKQGTAQMSNEYSVSGTGSELPRGQGRCWGVAESPVQCLVGVWYVLHRCQLNYCSSSEGQRGKRCFLEWFMEDKGLRLA